MPVTHWMVWISMGLDVVTAGWWAFHGRVWLLHICLVVAACSVLAMRTHRRWSQAGAWGLLVVGLATWAEYLFGIDLIDRKYTSHLDPVWPAGWWFHPGRMSIVSAVTMPVLAVGLLAWNSRWRKRFWWTHLCLVPVAIILYSGAVFHLYQMLGLPIVAFESWSSLNGIDFDVGNVVMGRSALLLWTVLVISMVVERSDRGIFAMLSSQVLLGQTSRWFLLGVVILPVMSLVHLQGQRLGWYSPTVGSMLFVNATAVLFVSMVLWGLTRLMQEEAARRESSMREQAALAHAEEANRLKDEFLATLSHELRTPLTAIMGWSAMLAAGNVRQNSVERACASILRAAQQQTRLVDDLLDISRIVTGNLQLDVAPVALVGVIKAALETIQPAIQSKGLGFHVVFASPEVVIRGDHARLVQVVWNLLSNAVKFTPTGGRIVVRLTRVASEAHITVEDTGRGIAASMLHVVFDRFRQVDSSRTRDIGGLGLGLSIVRYLVDLHGGWVTVESPGLGQGATFTVALPVISVDEL